MKNKFPDFQNFKESKITDDENLFTNNEKQTKSILDFLKVDQTTFQSNYQFENTIECYDTNEKNDFNEICKILSISWNDRLSYMLIWNQHS